MKPKLQTLKGFRDFLPSEASQRQWLINKIRSVFEKWGYDPIETPTLETLDLFKGQIGEDEKLFYKFNDPGGREIALRYDQTVPASRVVGQYAQELPMPFKRYQIQPAFRAEKPQKGRYREFLQCDADIFGTNSPYADAEVIALSLDIYREIGFKKVKVLINDRSLMKYIPYKAISSIDKIKKIGEDGVIKDMESKGISSNDAKKFIEMISNLKPNKTINIILDYLNKLNFDKNWYEFDPSIARSFSYSTGPIWEIIIPEFNANSVLGGERYDKLVENIAGVKIPATGFGLGFDRTFEAAKQFGLIPELKTSAKVLVTIFDKNQLAYSAKVVKKLRDGGINAEIYTDPEKKIDKQLKYADKKSIPFAIIAGQDEIKKNVIKLKNMKTQEQDNFTVEEVIRKLTDYN